MRLQMERTGVRYTGGWSRREFLVRAAAGAAMLAGPRWGWGLGEEAGKAVPAAVPMEAGALWPLLEGNVARPRLFWPQGDGTWARRNGAGRFTLALHGAAETVEAGDRPELRLRGTGARVWLGVSRGEAAKGLAQMTEVEVRSRAGSVVWLVRDTELLGRAGEIEILLTTPGERAGAWVRVRGRGVPAGVRLLWAVGGLGRSATDASWRVADCAGDRWLVREGGTAEGAGRLGRLRVEMPEGAAAHVADGAGWESGWTGLQREAGETPAAPVLAGSCALGPELLLAVVGMEEGEAGGVRLDAAEVDRRLAALDATARTVQIETPDADLNAAMPALLTAMESVWNEGAGSLVRAAGEQEASAGRRGPWALDALGQGARARTHLRTWMARQNVDAIGEEQESPLRGGSDPGSRGVRKDAMLHSNGDVGHCGCDVNLLFFNALLRHLRWTGDTALLREAWPALLRHMDWEYRLFRRPFGASAAVRAVSAKAGGGTEEVLPLYEAYGCVPEVEVERGNGGGSAVASAGNYFVNRGAAALARLLNQDPVPFETEAEQIRTGMERWLAGEEGGFAEGRDALGERTLYPAAGLWTAAAVLDAEMLSPRRAWEVAEERLGAVRAVPVEGVGVSGGGWVLPAAEWAGQGESLEGAGPALGTATCAHMALGLWKAGRSEEAWGLLRGTVVDSMARGDRPGALAPRLSLEPWLPEADAADVLGVMARALVEGLFGVEPDLLRGTLTLRPGFPELWDRAALRHPLLEVEWTRAAPEIVREKKTGVETRTVRERWLVVSRWKAPVSLSLVLRARAVGEPEVVVNGQAAASYFDPEAVGGPQLLVPDLPTAERWVVEVRWQGAAPVPVPEVMACVTGEEVLLPAGVTEAAIEDPRGCLEGGRARRAGRYVVFARVRTGVCRYLLPLRLRISERVPERLAVRPLAADGATAYEPVVLDGVLNGRVTEMLSRGYREPRSPWCSLGVPEGLLEEPFTIDDAGLRGAGGTLRVGAVPFATAAAKEAANCRFVSLWNGDARVMEQAVSGRARAVHVLLTGTSPARAMRCEHGRVEVRYTDGTVSRLVLRSPETWWPVERDWVLDDYLLRWPEEHAVPTRVELRTGVVRGLDLRTLKGRGGMVEGGAATVLRVPVDAGRDMEAVRVECTLYGVVLAVLGMTVERVG